MATIFIKTGTWLVTFTQNFQMATIAICRLLIPIKVTSSCLLQSATDAMFIWLAVVLPHIYMVMEWWRTGITHFLAYISCTYKYKAPPVNSTPAENTRQAAQSQEMDQLQNSFVKIELFEGDSSEDGRQWLERFQYLARFKNLTEAKRLETLPLLFGNKAYNWFEYLRGGHKR